MIAKFLVSFVYVATALLFVEAFRILRRLGPVLEYSEDRPHNAAIDQLSARPHHERSVVTAPIKTKGAFINACNIRWNPSVQSRSTEFIPVRKGIDEIRYILESESPRNSITRRCENSFPFGLENAQAKRDHKQCLSPFFQESPPEIRNLIYILLLVSKKDQKIQEPDNWHRGLTRVLVRMPRDSEGFPVDLGINPAILRVCWKTYCEALPILYGNNEFCFYRVDTLRAFRYEDLPLVHPSDNDNFILPVFNTQPSPRGRLSMIRKLSLFLTERTNSFEKRLPNPKPRLRHRVDAVCDWSPFLELSPYIDGSLFIEFPSLEELELDFSDWDLIPDVGLCVHLFTQKFRGSAGLKKLRITGVTCPKTLLNFKRSLLRGDGIFEAKDWEKDSNSGWLYRRIELDAIQS